MNLIYNFIIKDIKELKGNRKLLLFAVIGMIFPIIINIIATTPLVPMRSLVVMAVIFTTCLGGEFLFCFTVNEIKYRIFDIFLISKVGKVQLLLCKSFLPSLCSFLISIMSLVFYNIFITIYPKYGFVSVGLHFDIILLLMSGAIISTLLEFGTIISLDKFSDKTHTLTLFISFILIVFLYVAKIIWGIYFFYSICFFIILVLIMIDINLMNLYRRSYSSRKRYSLRTIFPERDISDISALIRKELIVSNCNGFTLISLIISSFFPLFAYFFIYSDFILLKAVFRITLYFVCTFGVMNLLLPVTMTEKINRYSDLFKISDTSLFKIYFTKIFFPFVFFAIGLILSLLVTWIYSAKTHSIFLFDFITMFCAILSFISSILISFWLSQSIKSHKDVRIVKIFVMISTLALHTIISFYPYVLNYFYR